MLHEVKILIMWIEKMQCYANKKLENLFRTNKMTIIKLTDAEQSARRDCIRRQRVREDSCRGHIIRNIGQRPRDRDFGLRTRQVDHDVVGAVDNGRQRVSDGLDFKLARVGVAGRVDCSCLHFKNALWVNSYTTLKAVKKIMK